MSLRYKGKPDPGFNVQVDKLPDLCFCKFVAVGVKMDDSKCAVHAGVYRCGGLKYSVHGHPYPCECSDYTPSREKRSPSDWPRCMCGHVAQDH